MKATGLFVCTAFFALFMTHVSSGYVYHVKQDGSGDFTFIQECADILIAGDVCIVHEGTYDERIVFAPGQSGKPGQWISFLAEPAGSVTMRGFNTQYANYLRIEGFTITDAPSGWKGGGVWVASNHVEIKNNYLYEIPYIAIVGTWGTPKIDDITVLGNRIYHCHAGIVAEGKNWLVEDNEVERLFDYGTYSCDYARFFGEHHIFRGNYFFGTYASEIGTSHVDCFQTFDNNTDGAPISDILIENNICLGFFHQGFMGEADFYDNTSDITIQNNIFAHGSSWGVCIDSNIKNVVVRNNLITDIGYHGIGLRNNATGSVYNNIICDVDTSYWATSGAVIEGDHNLIFNAAAPPQPGLHDLIGLDPCFTDPGNDDYSLRMESPAIDHGGAIDLYQDIDCNPRPLDGDKDGTPAWDIGPYEFGGPLKADKSELSETAGGVIRFTLDAGMQNGARTYLLLGTLSGTQPGHVLPGGLTTLPLNWDAFSDLVIANLNTPLFDQFFGVLDPEGRGTARIDTSPLPPGCAGTNLHFAYCLNEPFDFVSNPFEIAIVP